MKKTFLWSSKKNQQTLKLSKEKTEQLGEKQYNKAMKHMIRFNILETQRKTYQQPIDKQCTFKPKCYTQTYRGSAKNILSYAHKKVKNPQARLLQWGKDREKKKIQKILSTSVEIQQKVVKNLASSLEKPSKPSYLQKHFLARTISSVESIQFQKKKPDQQQQYLKKQSQTTLFSTNVKSRNSLAL